MQHTAVTLVIPAYNEEENLLPLLEEIRAAMQRQPRSWKALFVDDGSSDGSLSVLRRAAAGDPQVRYIAFEHNCGHSSAFAAGFAEADADVLVTLDADGQNDPSDIPALLDVFDTGYDMVIGWRRNRRDGPARRWSSKVANAVRNLLTRESVRDTGCSLKVLRADMARDLPRFNGMHRFLPTLMKMRGARVAEQAVNHRPRSRGVSKYGLWDRALPALWDLFAVRWMQRRLFHYTIRERK
ncbi:MAG: glycosyltransferase family 2 protein [Desulfovibrio sp.]|jgi:glycosyltransferase involved in cell wall biosynthesis|nr:glycosyltransferase family 2 protein [Desulfovibrio sp.]